MTRRSPSVMGFYKETDGPVNLVSRVRTDSLGLYLHLPSHLRNRLEVVVGNRLEVLLEQTHSDANMSRAINADALLEVKGYWHEMYLPYDVVTRYCIRCNDLLQMTLYRIHQHGRVFDI
ncbi:MAG: hypothetical protein LC660_03065 [Desulfobacteraceae bacterium]|nr:hypothetical protein [Desulfobacteraceae bacterium]